MVYRTGNINWTKTSSLSGKCVATDGKNLLCIACTEGELCTVYDLVVPGLHALIAAIGEGLVGKTVTLRRNDAFELEVE